MRHDTRLTAICGIRELTKLEQGSTTLRDVFNRNCAPTGGRLLSRTDLSPSNIIKKKFDVTHRTNSHTVLCLELLVVSCRKQSRNKGVTIGLHSPTNYLQLTRGQYQIAIVTAETKWRHKRKETGVGLF
ncbi:hypothetical protein J6590_066338 [Homalodisca vitripennis]|nr:hypothetical protein J6590_066338 [Homalodisca vitripennis]